MGSVRGAIRNKWLAGVGNLLMADHIFWSWLAHDPGTPGSCQWPGPSMMCADWRERLLTVHAALQPYIANGTYEGVFLGERLPAAGRRRRRTARGGGPSPQS